VGFIKACAATTTHLGKGKSRCKRPRKGTHGIPTEFPHNFNQRSSSSPMDD